MSRKPRFVIRTLIGLLLLGPLVAVAPATAATAPRVMLTGDSITQGFHGDYTWRYRLYKEFVRQHRSVNFVGSLRSPYVKPGWSSAQYLDPNFDQDHYAFAGATLTYLYARVQAEVAKQQPDIVVLMAGVNDLRYGATPSDVDSRLRRWISEVRAAKSNVRIIISPVLDAQDASRSNLSTLISQYDVKARSTVSQLSTTRSPITWADTSNGWSVATDTAGGLHPNPTGETVIAQRIGEALARVGLLTGPIKIFHPNTVWNRQPRVHVVIKNQRAVLSWDYQGLTSARIWVHRLGYAARVSPYHYTRGTTTTTPLAAGATYEFRVAFVRGSTVSPFGPITRVSVPGRSRPAAVSRVVVDARGVHWTRAAGATSYLVKVRRVHARHWITRSTTALYLAAAKVKRARVWAVNEGGRSPVRAARR